MGIRQKIRLGFFALGLLLFFSGLMSYFELNKLSNSTRNMLDASLKNMELSKEMLDAVQDQNTALLQIMVTGSAEYDSLLFAGRAKFDAAIREAKISIRDLRGLDSIYAANVQYTGVINNFFDNRAKTGRSDMNWFVGVYKTSYYDLTASDQKLYGVVAERDGCQNRPTRKQRLPGDYAGNYSVGYSDHHYRDVLLFHRSVLCKACAENYRRGCTITSIPRFRSRSRWRDAMRCINSKSISRL